MKAHSERVPGKNFRNFMGKPLFRWMLDTLLRVDRIAEVVINTDARDLLEKHGLVESERVRIRDRRDEICGDFVSMNLVLADDVTNVPADAYVMTHATNPLLNETVIQAALETFLSEHRADMADSLFSVTRHQARFYQKDGAPINHDPTNLIRTQDLEPMLEENSNLYIFTPDSFRATNARIGHKPILFETPALESLDIDDEQDWQLAERLVQSALAR